MARIKIELPAKCIAAFTIPVRITDINYGNHVGNNSMVEIIHEAACSSSGNMVLLKWRQADLH